MTVLPTKEQIDHVLARLEYKPTTEQAPVIYSPYRINLLAGGERSGKSKTSGVYFLSRFYLGNLYWLVAADYGRTRAEYDYICDGLDKLHIKFEATKQVDPGEIFIEGGFRVVTKSANDPRKLAMEAPDGIIGCEASQLDYETYLRLRSRIAERRGWLLLSGTFESSLGYYPELFERWQNPNDEEAHSWSLPSWTNINIFPGGRNDPEIKALERTHSQEWFLERFGGVPCPPQGIVFNEFRNHIHAGTGKEYELDPKYPCHIWVDPGYATVYAVEVAQKKGEDIYIVDEIYKHGLVTSDIIKICKQKPWWNYVIDGAIDVAATQHQALAPVSEIWAKEAGVTLRSKKVMIRDGIERVKTYLIVSPITGKPLLHVNSKCTGLISEMGGCPSPIDSQAHVYKWKENTDVPEDRNNHACKALSYGLVDLVGYAMSRPSKVTVKFF